MKPNHVPGFLMTHSALAVVLGLLCAWVIDLGNSAPVVILGYRARRRPACQRGRGRHAPRAARRPLRVEALPAHSGERGATRATLVASDDRSRGSGGPRPSAGDDRPHRRDAVAFPTFCSSASEGTCYDLSEAMLGEALVLAACVVTDGPPHSLAPANPVQSCRSPPCAKRSHLCDRR